MDSNFCFFYVGLRSRTVLCKCSSFNIDSGIDLTDKRTTTLPFQRWQWELAITDKRIVQLYQVNRVGSAAISKRFRQTLKGPVKSKKPDNGVDTSHPTKILFGTVHHQQQPPFTNSKALFIILLVAVWSRWPLSPKSQYCRAPIGGRKPPFALDYWLSRCQFSSHFVRRWMRSYIWYDTRWCDQRSRRFERIRGYYAGWIIRQILLQRSAQHCVETFRMDGKIWHNWRVSSSFHARLGQRCACRRT